MSCEERDWLEGKLTELTDERNDATTELEAAEDELIDARDSGDDEVHQDAVIRAEVAEDEVNQLDEEIAAVEADIAAEDCND